MSTSTRSQTLLRHLGDADPFKIQKQTPKRLHRLIASDSVVPWTTRPRETDWAPAEVLGHLGDAELMAAVRYRWTLCEKRPTLGLFDQGRWVSGLGYREADPWELTKFFESIRIANLSLWSRTAPAGRIREGVHPERGAETFELQFRLRAGHDLMHLEQLRQTLAVLGHHADW